jgi:hypothetical protein
MRRPLRFIVFALLLTALVWPSAATAKSKNGLGEQLVNRYLSQLQHHDVQGLKKFLSPAFQLQRADGTRVTKSEYLSDLPTLNSYTISNLRQTKAKNVLVATYQLASDLVVDGVPYQPGYQPRLATFVHGKKSWQLVSYANFASPQTPANP